MGSRSLRVRLASPSSSLADKASAVRQRFDAAHELAHVLLHRSVENKRLNTAADNKIIEDQAHYFANALLLPADQFVNEVWAPTLDAMIALKDRWKVSVGAMIKRCEALELVDRDQAQRLWINYNRRGWRKQAARREARKGKAASPTHERRTSAFGKGPVRVSNHWGYSS